jgi:uncharacterized damage-inducible protein DinB
MVHPTYMSSMNTPEPWLHGPIENVDPLLAPVLRAFEQAREDLANRTEGLTDAQIWASPHGFGPVGFHLRHIAGSVDRLVTYALGRQLSESQMRQLEEEKSAGGAGREELLAALERVFRQADAAVRGIDPATLREPREVGRKRLPTTVAGLLTHVAEHTARHVGQAISAAKLARVTTQQTGTAGR